MAEVPKDPVALMQWILKELGVEPIQSAQQPMPFDPEEVAQVAAQLLRPLAPDLAETRPPVPEYEPTAPYAERPEGRDITESFRYGTQPSGPKRRDLPGLAARQDIDAALARQEEPPSGPSRGPQGRGGRRPVRPGQREEIVSEAQTMADLAEQQRAQAAAEQGVGANYPIVLPRPPMGQPRGATEAAPPVIAQGPDRPQPRSATEAARVPQRGFSAEGLTSGSDVETIKKTVQDLLSSLPQLGPADPNSPEGRAQAEARQARELVEKLRVEQERAKKLGTEIVGSDAGEWKERVARMEARGPMTFASEQDAAEAKAKEKSIKDRVLPEEEVIDPFAPYEPQAKGKTTKPEPAAEELRPSAGWHPGLLSEDRPQVNPNVLGPILEDPRVAQAREQQELRKAPAAPVPPGLTFEDTASAKGRRGLTPATVAPEIDLRTEGPYTRSPTFPGGLPIPQPKPGATEAKDLLAKALGALAGVTAPESPDGRGRGMGAPSAPPGAHAIPSDLWEVMQHVEKVRLANQIPGLAALLGVSRNA